MCPQISDSRTFSKMFLSTFCSKSVHAADNILMSCEMLDWYSTLSHVSNTFMIITLLKIVQNRGCISFPKIGSHLRITGARRATWCKIHGQNPQILGTPVQDLIAMVTLCTSAAGFTREHSNSNSTALLCVAAYRNCPHETVHVLLVCQWSVNGCSETS